MTDTCNHKYATAYERCQAYAMRGLLGYMSTRCNVSSQHKLPLREELLGTITAAAVGVAFMDEAIDIALADGRLRSYDPYLSDREITVL